MAMKESGEMYLETIDILTQKGNQVRGIDIGEYMASRNRLSVAPLVY